MNRLGIALLIAAALACMSCDTTAFFAIDNRPLTDLEVVSVFPVHIGTADQEPVRVCGVPLAGETALAPDGVELVVNFVGAAVKRTTCAKDRDNSIHPGDEISLQPFIHETKHATVGPGLLDLDVQCIEPRAPAEAECSVPSTKGGGLASSLRYVEVAPRCGMAPAEQTRMELALVIDNSGSTVGFVDRVNLHEDQPGKFESPTPLVPSDPHSARTWAASRLLEQLNAGDRVIGYWYDEDSGIRVAASDNRSCEGGERDGLRCSKDAHCAGGWCQIGGAPGGNTLSSKTIPQWEKTAFGGGAEHRWLLDTDLQGSQKYAAEGRAPMWPAVGKAYDFLLGAAERNRQILVFADGPDTCNPSEDFDFTGSDGTCRLPCAVGGPDFETLRTKMHQAGWPVRLHFVQFQAPAYREPDAAMMEMACRSGGTYQFINSQEIALSGGDFSKALSRATARLRRSLGGTWRVNHRQPALAAQQVVARGRAMALSGRLAFDSTRFACPEYGFTPATMAHFTPTTEAEDGRLVFRTPCTSHSDCGGQNACGANHCTSTGLCVAKAAPDRLPCASQAGTSSANMCCSGQCAANCVAACTP